MTRNDLALTAPPAAALAPLAAAAPDCDGIEATGMSAARDHTHAFAQGTCVRALINPTPRCEAPTRRSTRLVDTWLRKDASNRRQPIASVYVYTSFIKPPPFFN